MSEMAKESGLTVALSGLGGDELLEDMRYLIFIQSIYQWFHTGEKFPINLSLFLLGYHQILSEAQTEDRRSEGLWMLMLQLFML